VANAEIDRLSKMQQSTHSASEISVYQFFSSMIYEGDITEVFIRDADGVGQHLVGSYEKTHLETLIKDVTRQFEGRAGVFDPRLLSEARNRLQSSRYVSSSTRDAILRRRRIMIDIDSYRPDVVGATDKEKQRAFVTLKRVLHLLCDLNWESYAVTDTGNGYCVYLKVDLPVEDDELVKKILKKLARLFDNEYVHIDTSVHDATRLGRVPGSLNKKGEHSDQRPHRHCRVVALSQSNARALTLKDLQPFVIGEADPPIRSSTSSISSSSAIIARANAYVAAMPPAIAGQGGHSATFAVACRLIIGFDLTCDAALQVIQEYNKRCRPPWSEAELIHKIESAQHEKSRTPEEEIGPLKASDSRVQITKHMSKVDGEAFYGYVPDFGTFSTHELEWSVYPENPYPSYLRTLLFLGWTKRFSHILLPDVFWRQIVWGSKYPSNWRRELTKWAGTPTLEYGGRRNVCCEAACLYYGLRVPHQHVPSRIETWGMLERFVEQSDSLPQSIGDYSQTHAGRHNENGVKLPARKFPIHARFNRDSLSNERRIGSMFSVYWPAYLFGASKRIGWTAYQQATIAAVTRELTWGGRNATTYGVRHDVATNAEVYPASVTGDKVACPLLDRQIQYACFGGNGRRKGRGYRLVGKTTQGWLPRCGYLRTALLATVERQRTISRFLRDLELLSVDLQLTVIGYLPNDRNCPWKDLGQLIACSKSRFGMEWLERCSLRIYTPFDWLIRWRQFFSLKLHFAWIPASVDDVRAGAERHVSSAGQVTTTELIRQIMSEQSWNQDILGYALSLVMRRPVTRKKVSSMLRGDHDEPAIRYWLELFVETTRSNLVHTL
jgi:hypothetical protein